jgi:hypothetical protein
MAVIRDYILSQDIPDIGKWPLYYVFENNLPEKTGLWLEFGVHTGRTINYIANSTDKQVYGFDSFEGLPEWWRFGYPKGEFDLKGLTPNVRPNVVLIKGWFDQVVENYLNQEHPDDVITFIHIDCDLYSSTKTVLDILKHKVAPGCIIIFDELVNYPEYDGDNGELRAWYEFIHENTVEYTWLGMKGKIPNNAPYTESVAVRIDSCIQPLVNTE